MTYDEADQLRQMIDGHWNLRMNEHVIDLWMAALVDKDPEITTRVISKMATTFRHPPRIVDLEELYAMMAPPHTPEIATCETCGGDQFMPYGWRKVEYSRAMEDRDIAPTDGMVEEFAPCPDCNSECNVEYFRFDGTVARAPDIARVREMLASLPKRVIQKIIDRPAWIKRWERARAKSYPSEQEALKAGVPNPIRGFQGKWRDLRPFPEQVAVMDPSDRPAGAFDDAAVWVQEHEYEETT